MVTGKIPNYYNTLDFYALSDLRLFLFMFLLLNMFLLNIDFYYFDFLCQHLINCMIFCIDI